MGPAQRTCANEWLLPERCLEVHKLAAPCCHGTCIKQRPCCSCGGSAVNSFQMQANLRLHRTMQTQCSQRCRPACPASSGWAHSAASGASLAREPCWAQRLYACLLHQESEAAHLEGMATETSRSCSSSDHAKRLLGRTSSAPWLLHAPHLDRPVPTLPHLARISGSELVPRTQAAT